MAGFLLDKWYADLVTAEGAGAFVYHATLRWRGVSLSYGELTSFAVGGSTRRRSTLRPGGAPTFDHSGDGFPRLCIDDGGLDVQARWEGCVQSVPLRLWESSRGTIDWNCAVPCAAVEGVFAGIRLAGLGYAERLVMTLPPWEFPSYELRWGRAIAEQRCVAWIGWSGGTDRLWVIDSSGQRYDGIVKERRIDTAGLRVSLDTPSVVIRDEELGRSLRGPASLLRAVLPRSVLSTHETKWLSRAEFADGERDVGARGWAIHELVVMGKRGGR